jgi:hypothetical protein
MAASEDATASTRSHRMSRTLYAQQQDVSRVDEVVEIDRAMYPSRRVGARCGYVVPAIRWNNRRRSLSK